MAAKGDRTPEKRKVGGSTPPLTTPCEQAKRSRRITRTGAFDGNGDGNRPACGFGYASTSPSLPSALRFSSSDVWA
jgi:hypothetical protein